MREPINQVRQDSGDFDGDDLDRLAITDEPRTLDFQTPPGLLRGTKRLRGDIIDLFGVMLLSSHQNSIALLKDGGMMPREAGIIQCERFLGNEIPSFGHFGRMSDEQVDYVHNQHERGERSGRYFNIEVRNCCEVFIRISQPLLRKRGVSSASELSHAAFANYMREIVGYASKRLFDVAQVLQMWAALEGSFRAAGLTERNSLEVDGLLERDIKFHGFGNGETLDGTSACILVNTIKNLYLFVGRDLLALQDNGARYRAGLAVWKSTEPRLAGDLSVENMRKIIQAMSL